MADLKDLQDVVKAGLDIAEALHDGAQWTDFTALLSMPAAIAGIENVPKILQELTTEQKTELQQFVKDNYDIPDNKLEELIEGAIAVCVDITHLIVKFKEAVAPPPEK